MRLRTSLCEIQTRSMFLLGGWGAFPRKALAQASMLPEVSLSLRDRDVAG